MVESYDCIAIWLFRSVQVMIPVSLKTPNLLGSSPAQIYTTLMLSYYDIFLGRPHLLFPIYGAIQVLRNAFCLDIRPPPTPS